jgi:hypothetical protein
VLPFVMTKPDMTGIFCRPDKKILSLTVRYFLPKKKVLQASF